MAPVPPAGALVATVGDLTNAITQLTEKIEEQKRWTQSELDLLRQKQTEYSEKTDETLKGLQTVTDAHAVDIADLKKTRVTTADFRQQITNIEMKAETANGALEQLIKKCREDCTRDLNTVTQNITTKVEACESGMQAIRDSVHEINSETIPDLRKQLEDERTKRRAEDLRLERQDEALREQFDRRCEEIIALLRKDIQDALSKITENCATKEQLEAILRDLAALRTSMTTQFSSIDDLIEGLKEALKSHREAVAASFDKIGKDITILMKDSSTMQSDLQQLTTNTTVDFKKIRDSLKDQIAQLHRDLSEARAAAAQAAVNNEKNIQTVAAEVTPLKEARSVLFDRLKIKDVAGLVRDWQAGHVPTTTASLSDLEARVARLKQDLQAEHDHGVELQKNVSAVRHHFRNFRQIADGLDPSDVPASGQTTTLPPIDK
jgi:DNA repair exonuclease SbcCD ATPase subunit